MRLAGLVAHHTGADHEARLRGLTPELDEFVAERSEVSDLLTYCDLWTGPDGTPISPGQRLADIARRYGPDDIVTRAITEATPELLATVEGVEERLRAAGLKPLSR